MRAFSVCGIAFCLFSLSLVSINGQERAKDKYEVLKEEWCGKYNCYDLLDVTPDVEFREIKQKYNNLSLELHPDKNVNATEEEKERYVRINKAYEILSSKRRDYDEYLRIKVSLDSPVESPILVLILLYMGIAYVVLYYQRQQQRQCKDAILKNASVVRHYWEEKKIDLTGKKFRYFPKLLCCAKMRPLCICFVAGSQPNRHEKERRRMSKRKCLWSRSKRTLISMNSMISS